MNGKKRLFEPYFEGVAVRVKKELISLEFLNEKIIDKLASVMAEKCMWIPLRCLILEMHELKEKNMLSGQDSVQMYESYLDDFLNDEKYLLTFNIKYPLVKKLINEKIKDTVDFIRELLQYLQRDKQVLEKEFCGGKEFDGIEDMEVYLSDEHISGKSVVRIGLDNGCVVYYKPKDLSVSRSYQEIHAWLMKECGEKAFPYPMICRSTYGWEKEIESTPCMCEREAEKYYKNIGIHLSLTYVLGVSDIHFENVIAHGEYPVITDIEFLGNIGCRAFTNKNNIQDYIADNVLSTGLLPVSAWLGGDNNVSGIGDTEDQRIPVKMPAILNKGTADMAIGYEYRKMKPGKNIPVLNGKKCDYRKYIGQIIKGFEAGYTSILQNKEDFSRKFQYGFKCASRVLMRNTQEYSMYGNILNFPELMGDATERKNILRHMEKGLTCLKKYRKGILNYEMKSVYKGEIPVFHQEGRDLVAGDGKKFENYYSDNIEERIIAHVNKLSEKDKELQKSIINVQFYSLFKKQGDHVLNSGNIYPELCQLTPEKIADYLMKNMWNINGKYEWATLQYTGTELRLGAADNYLYCGISGLAVFFAALNKKYNKVSVYRSVFEALVRQIKLHTDSGVNMGDGCEWGLFTGETSIIYTYLLIYNIIGDESYLIYAQKQADRMMTGDISRIVGDDLLSGKSGVITVYLKLYEYTSCIKYLDFAAEIADLLLAGARKKEKGIGWLNAGQSDLAGMAHGNSGIALGCALLWKYRGEERYMRCIKEALIYEDSLYDAEKHNWLDIREYETYGKGKDKTAWCHGCGGITLARRQIHELTGIPMEELFKVIVEKEKNIKAYSGNMWDILEEKLFTAQKDDSCLCHGMLGIYKVLKQINTEKAEKFREEIQHHRLSFEDVNNIGFMNGLSGIGYVLLEEEENKLPNILKIE